MVYFNRKNYIALLVSFVAVTIFLLIYSFVEAQGYQSISPLPGLEVVDTRNPSGLIQYFNRIFVIFISIVAVLGVIKLMICGFQYMTSEAVSSKEAAKKCMAGVFGGLFIVLLSVLVLQTINPSLIKLTFFNTLQQKIGDIEFLTPDFSVDDDGAVGGSFQFSVINICTGNFLTLGEASQDQCNSTLNTLLNLPRYTTIEGCFEEAGAYRYAVRESGTNCSQSRFDRFLPNGPIWNRDGPCQEALETELAEKNYGLTGSCVEVAPES